MDNVIEGNKFIAEFMEHSPIQEYCVSDGEGICYSPKSIGFDWPPQQKEECDKFLDSNHKKGRLLSYNTKLYEWHRSYNESWNELMPVVQKIKDIDNQANIEMAKLLRFFKDDEECNIFHTSIFCHIEEVYNRVVVFIKWNNKNQ